MRDQEQERTNRTYSEQSDQIDAGVSVMVNGKRVKAYWAKSCQHKAVGESAYNDGRYCAAASRLYYALRFAAGAILLKRTNEDYIPRPYLHKDLIKASGAVLGDIRRDLQYWFQRARTLREKGDYKDIPVRPNEIEAIQKAIGSVFEQIDRELNPQNHNPVN